MMCYNNQKNPVAGKETVYMHIQDYPQLLQVLEGNQKIVYLCGAGASMALGKHRASWGAWLQNGKHYLTDAEKEIHPYFDLHLFETCIKRSLK